MCLFYKTKTLSKNNSMSRMFIISLEKRIVTKLKKDREGGGRKQRTDAEIEIERERAIGHMFECLSIFKSK